MKHGKFLLAGAAAGLLNGLLGTGGGMVMVPMLAHAGLPAKRSHATSIAITLPLSLLSSLLYLSSGYLTLQHAIPFVPFGLIGAAIGSWLLPRMKSVWLHRIFGVLVLYSALRLLLQ